MPLHRTWALAALAGAGLQAAEPTSAEIAKQVAAAVAANPDWWAATKLNYPQSLDLTCPRGGKKWDPQLNPGQWTWDVVSPNPKRWCEGTKFWHMVLDNAKQKKLPDAERQATRQLSHCYAELLQDWPRALHWYAESRKLNGDDDESTIAMAHAYWRLGARTLAMQTLKPLTADGTRHGSLIKQWADMGDYATAYRLAQAKVGDKEDIGWFMAGYTAQLEGSWAKALDSYRKAAAAKESASGRDWKQTVVRAKAAIEAITLFETFDLGKVADGTYTAISPGYAGDLTVEVAVAARKIATVRVTQHKEKQYYASLQEVPAKIIAKQHVKGVDATLGATITSEAIVYGTAKALQQGRR